MRKRKMRTKGEPKRACLRGMHLTGKRLSSRLEEETWAVGESSSQAPRKRRRIIPLDPDVIPDRTGKDPYPYWECFQDQKGLALFWKVYDILDDVVILTIQGPRMQFSDEHITVPLMAIAEGGLWFPMHRVLRETLHFFKLTSCQLSVNSYRIIHSVIKLAEVKMFKLEAQHLLDNYMMSQNTRYSWYYLCSRRKTEKIVPEGMYDSKKWALNYLKATQSIMSTQCYLTEHDKEMKKLKQSLEHNQGMVKDYKKRLGEPDPVRQSQELQIANLDDLIKGLQDSAERTRTEVKDEGISEGRALGRKEMEEEMAK
ncbi:hypothetical protein RHMOL_Rhmol02G0177800 [Rhododendron molle]|uniref:Uncharacterized protein n=1 Tax=Rhododendron molle TaxID=49168 RepID=A0ACC0PTS4_RHOML|nr:hypothetical protein RHMOL_Rhmol02G0177800 [Rhododendron molle]